MTEHQHKATMRLTQLPIVIVDAFLRGMDPHRINFGDTFEEDPQRFLRMSIRGARYWGMNCKSAEGDRRFLWHFYGTHGETARALFVLPYCTVDEHTQRSCIAALRKLVLQYRKLDPLRFAAWVTKTYPQIDARLVQGTVLPSQGSVAGAQSIR